MEQISGGLLREFCEKVNNVLDRLQIKRIISHNFVARFLACLKIGVGVRRVKGAAILYLPLSSAR